MKRMSYIPSLDLSDDSCKQKKDTPGTFAKRLRYALYIRGVSQAELCKMTGIPENIVNLYVNRDIVPGASQLEQIAKALDMSELWLMG